MQKSDLMYCNQNQPEVNCTDLDAECIDCQFNEKCAYGKNVTISCTAKNGVVCKVTEEADHYKLIFII